jgi:hypothetical protein
MLYIIECGFADPAREAEWNTWYDNTKLDGLLAVPGFASVQRLRAFDDDPAPYMNITSIETPQVFSSPAYGGGGGGRFGDWDPNLILDWTRRLFTGIMEMPAVAENQRLVSLDMAPHNAPDLGVELSWLTSFDWETVSDYQKAVALDDSVPHRGLAILDAATAEALPRVPGLRVYRPICSKRVPQSV